MIKASLHKTWGSEGFNINVDFELAEGDFLCLFGESGSGKTTILRMLAGLTNPDSGVIEVSGDEWFNGAQNKKLPAQKRNVGMVFQDDSLFPNMTVLENILFAAEEKNRNTLIDELIEISQIEEFLHRNPSTLSGGQKQRVSLVRTLVRRPKLLLLDEPLSALDPAMRQILQNLLLELHQKLELTIVMVSHDLPEIFRLSTKVLELKDGEVSRWGTASELFGFNKISGQFQLVGHIVKIEQQDVVFLLSILVAQDIVKAVVNREEASKLAVGDKVLVAAKAFSPHIKKID